MEGLKWDHAAVKKSVRLTIMPDSKLNIQAVLQHAITYLVQLPVKKQNLKEHPYVVAVVQKTNNIVHANPATNIKRAAFHTLICYTLETKIA